MVWWVLHVGSTREFAAHKALTEAHVSCFLPHRSRTRKVRVGGAKGRSKRTIKEALFPGYVFLQPGVLDSRQIEELVNKRGRVVRIDGRPLTLNENAEDGLSDARLECDEDGFVGDTDSTALSFGFLGRAGTAFKFTEDSPFWGHTGIIVSTEALDKTGTIVAFIELFKAPRAVVVAKRHVGEMIFDMNEVVQLSLAA